jgi:tape measure domain-containing protein
MSVSLEEVGVHLTTRDDATPKVQRFRRELKDLKRDAEAGGRGLRDTSRSAGDLTGALGGLNSGLTRVSTTLGQVTVTAARRGALALSALGAAAVGFGLRSASSFEQSEIAFGTLLGSMEQGEGMLKRLQEFNLSTPFELPGLAGATQQLLLYGYAGEQAFNTVKTVSDIAASSGPRMEESLGRMTLALGQIRAKGVVQGEELRQLTEAGFPALELLTELTGRTGPELRKAMETGLDPQIATDFLAAVESGQARTFARFRGGAEAQARTLAGVVSNLKDTINVRLAQESKPLAEQLVGNMPALQASIDGLITTVMPGLTGLVGVVAAEAPGAIRRMTPALGELTENLGDLARTGAEHLPEFLGFASDLIGLGADLVPVVGDVVDVFGDFLDLPWGHEAAATLLGVLLGYRALSGVATAVTTFAGALDALTAAQARNAGVGGVTAVAGGGRTGVARTVAGATVVGAGALTSAAGAQNVYEEGLSWGNVAAGVGGGAATGAAVGLLGGPFAPVSVPVGSALGAAVGGVGVLGAEVFRRYNANEARIPTAAAAAAAPISYQSSYGDIRIDATGASSDVDVVRAVKEALREVEHDQLRRASVPGGG